MLDHYFHAGSRHQASTGGPDGRLQRLPQPGARLGAGWYEHEWTAYGYGFPELNVRMAMFKEACEIVHRMWTEDYPVFKGQYYTIDRPINAPKGAQKPHPPLWIGGSGEKVTLKLVAQFGDACNIDAEPETVRHKLAVLRQHCEAVGRPYEDIIKSCTVGAFVIDRGADPQRATAGVRGSMSLQQFPPKVAWWRTRIELRSESRGWSTPVSTT